LPCTKEKGVQEDKKLPCTKDTLTLKAVTDLVDDSTTPTAAQFEKNFQCAVAQLTERLLGFERFLSNSQSSRLELL
jgi:hypothetical protein